MSFSTRFLLLVIIGIAIAIIGTHLTQLFVGMAFLFSLMIGFYALPLLAVLVLLVITWRLIAGGSKPEKRMEPTKVEPIKPAKPSSHISIERDLNQMKHQLGQMNRKIK